MRVGVWSHQSRAAVDSLEEVAWTLGEAWQAFHTLRILDGWIHGGIDGWVDWCINVSMHAVPKFFFRV